MDTDEHPRPDSTVEVLSTLPPVFKKNGTVTAGNASVSCCYRNVSTLSVILLLLGSSNVS